MYGTWNPVLKPPKTYIGWYGGIWYACGRYEIGPGLVIGTGTGTNPCGGKLARSTGTAIPNSCLTAVVGHPGNGGVLHNPKSLHRKSLYWNKSRENFLQQIYRPSWPCKSPTQPGYFLCLLAEKEEQCVGLTKHKKPWQPTSVVRFPRFL